MVNILTELGEGNTVKLVPINAELTTQEAADLLNVSRPRLIKLLDESALPFHRTGNRRKVRDLMDLHVSGSLVTNYQPLIPSITLSDENDRHIVAAAIITL
ncbi:excisionase family DNA-binding protein [Alishewanella sp. d11]|uniref:excisionase family DNA-binding protein n=1 Tax=Alishewanella sp. d11 TaxID=3414030 RepID=UPI003BF7D11E